MNLETHLRTTLYLKTINLKDKWKDRRPVLASHCNYMNIHQKTGKVQSEIPM